MPDYMREDIDGHPSYTHHFNGFGLFFQYDRPKRFGSIQATPGIQVVLDDAVTAPGSVIENEPVLLRGEITNAPELPDSLYFGLVSQ